MALTYEQVMRHRPKRVGVFWAHHGDCGLPHFQFWTDWWSFRLVFCCQAWGFTICYFAPSMTHHALETGYHVWGRQSHDLGQLPPLLDGQMWRVGIREAFIRGYV